MSDQEERAARYEDLFERRPRSWLGLCLLPDLRNDRGRSQDEARDTRSPRRGRQRADHRGRHPARGGRRGHRDGHREPPEREPTGAGPPHRHRLRSRHPGTILLA